MESEMKKYVFTAVFAAFLLLLSGVLCGAESADTADLQFSVPERFEIETDILTDIPCTARAADGIEVPLTFTVSPSHTAAVFGRRIQGLKSGEATVTASAPGGESVSFTVTVIRPVWSVTLDRSKTMLDLYGSMILNATVFPADASRPEVVWTSSDATVASVDESGLVRGLSSGVSVITASSADGKSASCVVTVFETRPTSFELEKLYLTMKPGESRKVTAFFTPEKAQDQTLLLESSDTGVVTVGEDGFLTAVGKGTATVTAVCRASPSLTDSFKVCVIDEDSLPLEGLVIGINPGHQMTPGTKKLPVEPGSSTLKSAVGVGTKGKYTGIPEYETNLAVSLKLRDLLENCGAEVVMTRTENDVMLTNIERAWILNKAGVDIAIQVHCDDGVASASGISAYYRGKGAWVGESRQFADTLCRHICGTTGAVNRGTFVCNTYMSLNYSGTPSVLIEMGFMDNRTEDYLLADDAYRSLLAQGMLEAIADYFERES